MNYESSIIGVDLGGTKIALTRFNSETWGVEEEMKLPTHADKAFHHVLADLLSAIEALRTESTKAIGIGVPGLVRQPDGHVITMPNISDAQDIPLKEQLGRELKLPVFIDNDANCFTLAEATHGAGKGHAVVIGVTLGTGVGGGIVIDGKIFHGAHGFASEIGHMLLKPGEPPFETDDKRGDVEQFLSGESLGKRCPQTQDPKEYLEGETCAFLHEDFFQEVAWMCVNLIHLSDPSVIIFGGTTGRALSDHLPEIQKELRTWLLPGTPLPTFAIASLKNAETMGAALLTV